MNHREYLLICLMEECAEVQKAASKSLRFGLNDSESPLHPVNKDVLVEEVIDLLALIGLVFEDLHISQDGFEELVEIKNEKVLKYMKYSKERGILSD